MSPAPLPAVNHYLCPSNMGLEDFLILLGSFGFYSVGLTERAIAEAGNLYSLKTLMDKHGMTVSSVNSAGFFLAETESAIDQQTERNRLLIQVAAAFEGAVLNVIVGGSSHLALREARNHIPSALALLARQAEREKVPLVVEPLNVLNARGKSCINTLRQVEELFEKAEGLDSPPLALNLDLFHTWWDPDLDVVLSGRSVQVGLLQICDAGQDLTTLLPHRLPLDEGHVDWRDILSTFRNSFPNSTVELELFADQLPNRFITSILADTRLTFLNQEAVSYAKPKN